MKCYRCPCIQDQFDFRIRSLDGSDICGHICYDEAEYDHVDYCYCDKVGGKLYNGRCDEAEWLTEEEWDEYREEHNLPPVKEEVVSEEVEVIDPIPEPTRKQRRWAGDKKHRHHLMNLFFPNHWCSFAYPVNKRGHYDPDNPVRYKRAYSPRRAKFLRKISNRKVRRTEDVGKRGGYKKIFDLPWELW